MKHVTKMLGKTASIAPCRLPPIDAHCSRPDLERFGKEAACPSAAWSDKRTVLLTGDSMMPTKRYSSVKQPLHPGGGRQQLARRRGTTDTYSVGLPRVIP